MAAFFKREGPHRRLVDSSINGSASSRSSEVIRHSSAAAAFVNYSRLECTRYRGRSSGCISDEIIFGEWSTSSFSY